MKAAMWGVMLFIIGIFGIVLINIFGNITTTNQQDYTLLRNTVEAAMFDAMDIASFRNGFYVCTNKETSSKVLDFKSTSEYQVILNNDIDEEQLAKEYKSCNLLIGEVKLKQDVFMESFFRRFASDVNNSKSYKVTVQEIIEYPPKVSIRIDTYDTYNSSGSTTVEFKEGDFQIRNQIDAILESTNEERDYIYYKEVKGN